MEAFFIDYISSYSQDSGKKRQPTCKYLNMFERDNTLS